MMMRTSAAAFDCLPSLDGAVGTGRRHVAGQTRPSPAVYQVEWQPLCQLATIVDQWDDLSARVLEPNIFYEPALALRAASMFGVDAGAVLVWSRSIPRRLLGLFPLRITRQRHGGTLSILTGWTHPLARLGTPLIDRNRAPDVIDAFLDYLSANRRFPGLVLLPLMAEQGAVVALFRQILERRGHRLACLDRHNRSLLVPTAGRLDYLERSLGPGRLSELHRLRRRLEASGPVRLLTATQRPAVVAALGELLTLEASTHKPSADAETVAQSEINACVRSGLAALAAKGQVRIDRLMVANRSLAVAVTLLSNGTAWLWRIAHDETLTRVPAAQPFALKFTHSLLADATIARVDCCGDTHHEAIDHIWRERLTLSDWLIAARPGLSLSFPLALRLESLRGSMANAGKRFNALAGRRGAPHGRSRSAAATPVG